MKSRVQALHIFPSQQRNENYIKCKFLSAWFYLLAVVPGVSEKMHSKNKCKPVFLWLFLPPVVHVLGNIANCVLLAIDHCVILILAFAAALLARGF